MFNERQCSTGRRDCQRSDARKRRARSFSDANALDGIIARVNLQSDDVHPKPALLALADGTLWPGLAFGAVGERSGELVFNTCMTGYQEVLTDPSYHGQIPVMTQPHIGNTGANDEDDESERCWVAGFIVRSASPLASNWRANRTLDAYLRQRNIVGMTEVDTRALVRHIRTRGAMNAALSSVNTNPERLVALARAAPDMNGLDLAREVTCAAPYEVAPDPAPGAMHRMLHVVAYDFGIKRNILRLLAEPQLPRDRRPGAYLGGRRPRAEAGWRLPVQRAGRSRRRNICHRGRPARCWAEFRSSASAWATKSSRWRWAARHTS